jgi:hypothetical protein
MHLNNKKTISHQLSIAAQKTINPHKEVGQRISNALIAGMAQHLQAQQAEDNLKNKT